MLQFKAEEHKYFLNETPIPGVNEILDDMKFVDVSGVPTHLLEYSRSLGEAVHLTLEYEDRGILDIETVDPSVFPYLEAYRSFKKDKSVLFKEDEIEVMDYSNVGFAGRIDRLWNGEVLDIKTGGVYRSTRLQTAGYSLIRGSVPRWALYLKNDGSYCLKSHNDKRDLEIFLNLVEAFHWKHPRYSRGVFDGCFNGSEKD